jgi:uncharacterized protein YfdQ (DUF2303 family)
MIENEASSVQALLDAGGALVEPTSWSVDQETVPDVLTAVVPQGYKLEVADLAGHVAKHMPTPRRVVGTAVVTDTPSWLAYFGKHGGEHSEVFGDVRASTVTAILNAPPGPDAPAWGDHRVVLKLEHSAAWTAWTSRNGQMMSQTAFAEHLEDRTPDLVEPSAATMLELAQSFQATTGVQFESSSRLHDGQRRFQYLETTEGKAGQRGELDIPTSIRIQVPVWRGVAIGVPMTARFRFRAGRDGLTLGYVLDRVDDVLDAAWASLLGELTETLPVPVLAGAAPSYAGRS